MAWSTPSPLELQILALLWEKGALTARQARAALPDGKPRAYTTVLSVLQGMERKGLVAHDRMRAAYVYRARVARRDVLRPILRDLVAHVFGGRISNLLAHLLEETSLPAGELEELRRLVENYQKSGSGDTTGTQSPPSPPC